MKKFTVAILGVGSRGAETFGRIMSEKPDEFEIVSLCDIKEDRLLKYKEIFQVSQENLFVDETLFFQKKRAEVLVIATQDNDHIRHCIKALELGYDILLEKPITKHETECYQLLETQKKYGGKVVVCHGLRYAPAFLKIKELLEEKICGDLVLIDSIEQVSYWHQAHSFVRGNWRNSEQTSPMILQKCCHDLDLLQYYVGAKCETLSSIGGLNYFKKETRPQGAADRCVNCQYHSSCSYSAENIYIKRWYKGGSPENMWPFNVITETLPLTETALRKAIEEGPYGKCVYLCDNDVVDNQIVTMTFENGVRANLRMTAFTKHGGRLMKFHCTDGEIEFSEKRIIVRRFNVNTEKIVIDCEELNEGGYGHAGGDSGLVNEFYKILCGNGTMRSGLENSIESHLMAIRAEESRLQGGVLLFVHPFA